MHTIYNAVKVTCYVHTVEVQHGGYTSPLFVPVCILLDSL